MIQYLISNNSPSVPKKNSLLTLTISSTSLVNLSQPINHTLFKTNITFIPQCYTVTEMPIKWIANYRELSKNNPNNYWFKRVGEEWYQIPVNWMGWITVMGYFGYFFFLSYLFIIQETVFPYLQFTLAFILFHVVYLKKGEIRIKDFLRKRQEVNKASVPEDSHEYTNHTMSIKPAIWAMVKLPVIFFTSTILTDSLFTSAFGNYSEFKQLPNIGSAIGIFGIFVLTFTVNFKFNQFIKHFQEIYKPNPPIYPLTHPVYFFNPVLNIERQWLIWKIMWTPQPDIKIEKQRRKTVNGIYMVVVFFSLIGPIGRLFAILGLP